MRTCGYPSLVYWLPFLDPCVQQAQCRRKIKRLGLKHRRELACLLEKYKSCKLTICAYESIYRTWSTENRSTINTVGNVGVSRLWLRIDPPSSCGNESTSCCEVAQPPVSHDSPTHRVPTHALGSKRRPRRVRPMYIPTGSQFYFITYPFRACGKHEKKYIRSLHSATSVY